VSRQRVPVAFVMEPWVAGTWRRCQPCRCEPGLCRSGDRSLHNALL